MGTTDWWSESKFILDYIYLYTILGKLVIFFYNDWVHHHINKCLHFATSLACRSWFNLLSCLIQFSWNLQSSVCSCQGILVIKSLMLIRSKVHQPKIDPVKQPISCIKHFTSVMNNHIYNLTHGLDLAAWASEGSGLCNGTLMHCQRLIWRRILEKLRKNCT